MAMESDADALINGVKDVAQAIREGNDTLRDGIVQITKGLEEIDQSIALIASRSGVAGADVPAPPTASELFDKISTLGLQAVQARLIEWEKKSGIFGV